MFSNIVATGFEDRYNVRVTPLLGARWLKWLEYESTDLNVRGSKPTPASRFPLSRLSQPTSLIPKEGKHWTRVSVLLELISSGYPMAVLGFELRKSDVRSERVTTVPPAHVGRI
ncbi:hypothetical protein T265_07103 [Opisthorchis viverrini]|uniref:Uncharacterized protein n=1 Tax=Opisthorchis viverrini TaxID=6198 RepID=A0A074ZDQ5_OPIVI|nr:hypothetical protein T265_07103 [Opisthorchis viverrini]KER25421.1 hypothetical protein T265_07103 [Opisthorchis viverrini]